MAESATKLTVKNDNNQPARKDEAWLPLTNLRREIDRLFDDFHPFSRGFPFGGAKDLELAWPKAAAWQVAPAMDLAEKDGEYEISAELPGLDDKNVEVKVASGTLTIKGEKSEEKEEKEKDYYLSERRYGSFQRSFRIPEGVDVDKIEANLAKGVLTVKLPKSAEAKKDEKKIAVKAA